MPSVDTTTTEFRCKSEQQSDLPVRLRLLCIGSDEPSWVNLSLQLDAEGCSQPHIRWVSTTNEALSLLRKESFDCIVICESQLSGGDQRSTGAVTVFLAIRATGCDDPAVLMKATITDTQWSELSDGDCEILVTENLWESSALGSMIKRAISRAELTRENHRMALSTHRRTVRERDEAEHLLDEQRQIIEELARLTADSARDGLAKSSRLSSLPKEVQNYYHELLRTYVIMGSGRLGTEIGQLAELLMTAELSPREALELHVERVESLVSGLGNRSTRHVMARADLLALELVIHLGECYQRQLLADQRRLNDDHQRLIDVGLDLTEM